jgi:DNA-directed RNA polymerase subunit RPC12/RpoP
MKVYPFKKVVKALEEKLAQGWDFYLQFNCANCGTKQTIDTPNIIYKTGRCEECGHITNIEHDGCNYMLYGHR